MVRYHPTHTHARVLLIPCAGERRDMLLRTALPGWGSVGIRLVPTVGLQLQSAATATSAPRQLSPAHSTQRSISEAAASAHSHVSATSAFPFQT